MFSGFVFGKRFGIEAEDLGEERHGQLRQKDARQAKPKGSREEWFAEVVGNAGAEEVGQCGEEEMEWAEEFYQFTISDICI